MSNRMSCKHLIRQGIEESLLPVFFRAEFGAVPLGTKDGAAREFKIAFPFGRLRRDVEGGAHVAEIQLHDRNCAFRVNFGFAPSSGIDHPVSGHIELSDIWASYLPEQFELLSSALFRKWFSAESIFRSSFNPASVSSAIQEAIKAVPELELALNKGILGRHVRKIRLY